MYRLSEKGGFELAEVVGAQDLIWTLCDFEIELRRAFGSR
ncbi:hypothetical protein QTN31_15660 [Alicyclobacillus cycloheptanicus]